MNKLAAVSVACALLATSGGANASPTDDLKAQLDQAMKVIQDLQKRVNALENEKKATAAAPPVAQAPAPQQPASRAPVVTVPGLTPEEGVADADKARFEISGHIMADAIYDAKRVDPNWNATLRPSKIPVNCPGDAGCGKDGETIMSVKQTKLAFNGYMPTELGEMKTLIDIDLFNTGGAATGTNSRLLDAWGELGPYGAGQYYTVFMDIDVFPNTIDYWGPPGMVFIRNPQLRYTPIDKDGIKVAFALEAPYSAIDTGKVSQVDPALGAAIAGHNRTPDLTAAFRMDRDWGHVQVAGVVRQVGFENTASPTSDPAGHENGGGINLSGVLNTFDKDRITAQVVMGKAIASYMNDGGVDLAPGAGFGAETVKTIGWLTYYDRTWSDKWTSSIGFSQHRQDNTSGQLGNAFHSGSYGNLNLLYYPMKNIMLGPEFVWGRLENKDGASQRDYRVQFSTKFKF